MPTADRPDGGQAHGTVPVHTPGEPIGGSFILADVQVHAHHNLLDWILCPLLQGT